MRKVWLAALAMCLIASGAWAQGAGVSTARSLGMGGAVIGVADDAAAWYQNPAGLAALNVPVQEGKLWGADVAGIYANQDTTAGSIDSWGLLGSGWQPDKRMGFGLGFGDVEDYVTIIGGGFGMGIGDTELSAGISIVNQDYDDVILPVQTGYSSGSDTLLNLGFLYRLAREDSSPIRLGLLIEDLTDETDIGPWFSAGVAWPANPEWLVALDLRDITDESDNGPYLSGGVEYKPAKLANWAFRAGLYDDGEDHNLTLGAGYAWERWRLDAAYGDMADGVWSVTASIGF